MNCNITSKTSDKEKNWWYGWLKSGNEYIINEGKVIGEYLKIYMSFFCILCNKYCRRTLLLYYNIITKKEIMQIMSWVLIILKCILK